ncbi:unnamed protein product, partial [Sphacelaria rigidula]
MWKIPKTHGWGATSGALLRRRPGQNEREIRHRNRSRGNEVSAPLSPPSRPTHATSAVESGSPLTPSECAAPVENVRDIAEGHTGERVKPQNWLSPCSYGKDTATVLFSAPEASFASSDGASVEKQGLEGCYDHPSAEGRNFKFRSAGEGATRKVSIASASENSVREVSPRNPPTVPLKDLGNTPCKIGRAAGGRAPEVKNSTPSAEAKKRRTP